MKKIFLTALIFILLLVTGCNNSKEKLSEDFEFSITWGTYGESSYDSRNGKLIKTTNATYPEDYVTSVALSEDERAEIYKLLNDLNVIGYPDEYDPFNNPYSNVKLVSTPSQTLILSVKSEAFEKTITCRDVSLSSVGYNMEAQKFLNTINAIKEILMETDEWKALPEYEFYYD